MLLSFGEIAMLCHEQNRAYNQALDQGSSTELLPWSDLEPDVQTAIEVRVKRTALEDPDLVMAEPENERERVQQVLFLRMIQTCMELQ